MDKQLHAAIERLHEAPTMAVLAVAGAGGQALAWLLSVPGASRTILEALVPYSSGSLTELIGSEPSQHVSEQTAVALARAAYRRAVHLREGSAPVIGVGCTATIATDRPKRGQHRCHVAVWQTLGVTTYTLVLVKSLRDRAGEEEVVSRLVIQALSEASGTATNPSLGRDEREDVTRLDTRYEDPVAALCAGHVGTATIHPDGSMLADEPFRGGVLPGSFNPLHEAHEGLASVAAKLIGAPVIFELSVANVDKPPLEEVEVRHRGEQFAGRHPLALTRTPTFHEKALLFPGCTFVIGWDTAVRLFDPRYYDGRESKILVALEQISDAGCRFLVAGREERGRFQTLADVAVPQGFGDMFIPIPESAFRCDVSSSQLRLAGRRV